MRRNLELEATIVEQYAAVEAFLDERGRRLWAATESRAIGYGGDALVSDATGLSRPTIRAIRAGRRELESGSVERGRIRRPGAARPGIEQSRPGIEQALEKLVDPLTRGDPESPLRWTCKSRAKLTAALSQAALSQAGWQVSSKTASRSLHELGCSLQSVRKSLEGTTRPDRDAQFEHIHTKADDFPQRCQPVVSVDTKSTPRRRNWRVNSRTAGGHGNRRGAPGNHWCMIFPRTRPAKRCRMASMTWGATKPGCMSDVITTRPRLPRPRCDGGGTRRGSAATPRLASCSSLPMRAVATGIALAPGSIDCRSSLTGHVFASTSAASRRGPVHGIRLSAACSATSRRIGEASHCVHLRPLST